MPLDLNNYSQLTPLSDLIKRHFTLTALLTAGTVFVEQPLWYRWIITPLNTVRLIQRHFGYKLPALLHELSLYLSPSLSFQSPMAIINLKTIMTVPATSIYLAARQ